jgi:hypothetical protein
MGDLLHSLLFLFFVRGELYRAWQSPSTRFLSAKGVDIL